MKNPIELLKDKRSKDKLTIDKYLDSSLFVIAANGLYLWAADKTLDLVSQNVDSNEGLAMLGTYTGLTAGLWLANKFPIRLGTKWLTNRTKRKISSNRYHFRNIDDKKSWIRTGIQIAALPIISYIGNIPRTIDNFRYDGERVIEAFARETHEEEENLERKLDETPKELKDEIPKNITEEDIINSNKYSINGKFLRTYRWRDIIIETEQRYGIEEGLLGAVAMHESYGDPLELNGGNDGGAGLMMFQPGTAQAYGLKTWGNSRRAGRDRNHGVKLRKLAQENNWNYERLRKLDERFDVEKSLDAAARYLKDMKKKYKTWDKALSAYNQGTPSRKPENTKYVKHIRAAHKHWLSEVKKR